ncbi:hypothetical protein E4U17_002317 [Claviceps sp. LM77 group G4]|nr:hypothetical protein E4U17_002317 [Claviceps sp. LM77 group G4]KAG6074938.1 hypothetical protein E4U33_002258 [Claviceps sp. LM78 group G4]KAG6083944.1 hypothetical protein E4U16_002954 [Claviceps sp. LM84 group G4]
MSRPTSAMAGAFPLVESSSMEYTTTEDKIVYWPGAPRLGELVADDLVVIRPGRNLPEERANRLPDPGKKYTVRDVRLLQSRSWEWHTAAAEEELARRLAACDDWPVMVPEDDEGQAWIEVPECDKSTEWTTDVFRTRMIEAARQREVALGFVSDLLAIVAMQNGHIEAMAKHTNRITQHSEMVCQDLHDQVRVLTEQLAMGVDQEANKLQTLKEQFTRNVEDLKRAESERDRLRQENQDLRESPEIKRESSPRGGRSGKSGKIPDPERLDTGVSPKYKAWKGDMIAKLTINEDWSSERGRPPHGLGLGPSTDSGIVQDPVGWQIYIDPDEKNTAREKLRELQLTTEGFTAFRSAFYRLAQTSGEPRETWKDIFYRKLPKQWQKTLADNHANEAYTTLGKGTDSQRAKKGKPNLGNSQPVKAELNAGGRLFSPEHQKRKEEGACYGCGKRDHIARFCPKKRAGVNAVKQISDTREVEELADSDSGNEEA